MYVEKLYKHRAKENEIIFILFFHYKAVYVDWTNKKRRKKISIHIDIVYMCSNETE